MTTYAELAEQALERGNVDHAQVFATLHVGQRLDQIVSGFGPSLRNAPKAEAPVQVVERYRMHVENIDETLRKLGALRDRGYSRRSGNEVPGR